MPNSLVRTPAGLFCAVLSAPRPILLGRYMVQYKLLIIIIIIWSNNITFLKDG